jgi:hypothetical protein
MVILAGLGHEFSIIQASGLNHPTKSVLQKFWDRDYITIRKKYNGQILKDRVRQNSS